MNMITLLGSVVALVAVAAASLAVLRWYLKRLHHRLVLHVDERCDNLYQQLELRDVLHRELDFRGALAPTRGWAASPDLLVPLVRDVRARRPRTIVECSSGTSTVALARAAQLNGEGHVYSLEHDADYAERTRQLLRTHGLEEWAEVIDAPLQSHDLREGSWKWYALDRVPDTIDLLVIDGPPAATQSMARYPAIPLLRDRFAVGCHIYLDDADRPDEREAVRRWIEEYHLSLEASPPAEKGMAVLSTPNAA